VLVRCVKPSSLVRSVICRVKAPGSTRPGCGFTCSTTFTCNRSGWPWSSSLEVARVSCREEDHLVTRPEVEAARDEVVRLARVAREDDLLGRDTQGTRRRACAPTPCLRRASPVGERRIAIHVLRGRNHGLDDRDREGHRLAAFITPRSAGIRNCSRTERQKLSPAAAAPPRRPRPGPALAPAGEKRRHARDPQPAPANRRRLRFIGVNPAGSIRTALPQAGHTLRTGQRPAVGIPVGSVTPHVPRTAAAPHSIARS